MGMFDDLIPQAKPSGMFDDLIPDQPSRGNGSAGRGGARGRMLAEQERQGLMDLEAGNQQFEEESTFPARVGYNVERGIRSSGAAIAGMNATQAAAQIEEIDRTGVVPIGVGPRGETFTISEPNQVAARRAELMRIVEDSSAELARQQGQIAEIPVRPATEAVGRAKGFGDAAKALMVDPLGVVGDIGVQSMTQMAPALATAALTKNPVLGAGLMGMTSGAMEYGSALSEVLGQNNVDASNPEAVKAALQDPEIVKQAQDRGVTRAAIIGTVDMLSGGVAATKLVPNRFGNMALQTPIQAGLGGGGEALGQLATDGELHGGQILLEAAGEGFGAPAEVLALAREAKSDPVAAGIQAADEIFEQAAQDSQADVQPVTSAAQPAPKPAQDAEIDALLTPELDITPETESALDAAVTPPLGEPMSGGRVLFRGDPAEIRQKIADAGLRNAGGILQEDGEPVGVYFSASVADQVREVLGVSEASNIESASSSPDQAGPVVQQDQRVVGDGSLQTSVMEGVNNGVQSDSSGAGAPGRQADGNDGSGPSELGGVGDVDQIGTAESVSAVGGNQSLTGSRPLDPDERSRADFEARLAKASEGLPPERVEQLRQLYQERPRDRVTGLYRSEDLTDTVDIAHAESATTPAVYIEMDFANLGGLNKRVGNSAADPFLKKAADVARVELEGAGATIGVRKGGDEFGFVVRGITQEQADAAMDRARAKFAADPDVAALADTPNPKAGRGSGIGIHYGTAQIDPDVPVADTIKAADTLVEARKDGAPYGRREREAAGSDRTVTRAAQGAPGAVEPRDGRVDSPAPRSSAAAEEQGSRLSDDTQLSWVDNKIGMAERGGHAIREFAGWEAPGEAAQGPVVARTTWHDPDAWGGEAGFWQSRPDPLTEAQARKALKKYREGKRLGSREQRFIDYAKSEAAFRDEQFESENAKYAEELRLQSDIDRQALFDELKAEVLSAGYNLDASEETEALTLFGWVDRAMSAGVPKAAIEAIDFTAPETDQVREFASLIREYSSESREAQGSGVGVDQDTGAPRAEEAAEPAEARTESDPLELEALTPEQATERAEAEQARQRQERNEQRAADRAEQRRREQAADRQQAADRNEDMAANFRLGQSDAEVRNEIAGQNDLLSPVDQAAAESAQSPENDLPEPTEAQKEAGNYKLGHVRISGMDVSIETPAGSSRRPEWPPLKHHYGYIKRTEGADGDHVDVFLGPKAEGDTPVFVVNQIDPKTGKFDEHKVMIGFDTEADARDGYAANYAKDWKGLGSVVEMSRDEFKAWLKDGDTGKPAGNQSKIEDLGEKIGGARKDTATPTGKSSAPKVDSDEPGWRRRYQVSQVVAGDGVGRWFIHDKRKKGVLGSRPLGDRNGFETKEEAEAAIPLIEVARNHRVTRARSGETYEIYRKIGDRKHVIVKTGFESRDAAMLYMAQNAVEIIETNTTFGEIDLPRPPSRERSGPERRQGDVEGKDFMGTFGFRGVEFGNWNNQVERQELLNDAYDGLLDLADVMDIPPKAISLGGELALAFGARGHGLSAARAHYEPTKVVINLTKENGAGSLAHEWMHALDHYFGRSGRRGVEWVADADGTRKLESAGNSSFLSFGMGSGPGVRPELKAAFNDLMKTLSTKAEQYVEDQATADNFVAKSRADVAERLADIRRNLATEQQWGKKKAPATQEQLAEFDTLAESIIDGRQVALKAIPKNRSSYAVYWSNEALDGISKILKKVRGRGGFSGGKDTLDRLGGYITMYAKRLEMLDQAKNEDVKTKRVPTEFAMDAKSLDQGRGTDYWTQPWEMLARAFQGYVEDKIAERGGQSPFLNYGPENVVIPTPWGAARPFPRGDERKAINAGFDKLVETIESKTDDAGNVILFQRATAAGMPPRSVQAVVNRMSAQWENAPSIRVIASMSEAPEAVRLEDAKQKRGGATGDPAGFWHQGTVYVVASGQASPQTVARTVLHEVKGHAGLRGAFPDLQPVLQRIIDTRSDQVRAKAKQYGLDMSDANQAFTAAEEVLAEMAETNPRNGLVKRAIAAVKQFLRKIGVLDSGSISNEEIVREYLAPAARFVEGRDSGGVVGVPAFQRSAETIEVDGTQRPRTNSNGKPIAQTDEALRNFWRWFGDSKVVDEQGRPMVVYHGTAEVKRIAPRRIQPNKAKREAREQAIDRLSALGREHGITEWASVASVFERWMNFGMAEERGLTPEIAAEARRLMDANYAGQPRWTEGRTELGFSAFDMPSDGHELGAHFGTKQQANAFGNAFPFYLSIQSPARLPDLGTWNYQSVIRDLRKRGVEISEADYDAVFNAADNNDALRELLASKGVDGVVYKNMAEGKGDSYITFRPEQIKSATGNHTFDPANPDIRFRRNQAQPDERTSVRKLWDGFLDRFVDEFTSLTQAERATEAAGITLTDKEKARRAENLRHGKFQEKVRQARRDYFEPIAKILGDAKLDREGLADYLWWRHAPERDAVLRAKHKGNPDPDALAGISPKEAQANIDALPQAERQAYEQAAALIDKLRAKTLQVLQDSGQVAPETVDALKSAYQFYVPLRGLPEGSDPELNTAGKLYGVGRGLSVNQNPLGKKALGRKSKPSDIIEEMKSDLERALIGAEKQKVLRRVINLMAANPEIGSIDAVEHVKQEVNGLIQYVPKTITENTVTFLHKGKPVRLKMANPRLERALLNINETPVAAIQKLAKVTRWLSAVKTSLSPYFMLINPVRDGLFAGMGIGSEKGIKHLASFGKYYGAAWRSMYRDERNKLKDSAIDTYAKEFTRAGGKTGYTYANSIEDIGSELNRLFTQYRKGDGPKGMAKRIWYKVGDMIEAGNNIAENATRLAVFAAMRDNGASVEESAQYAKEVTVNFNVRGTWGKNFLNAAYMFFNASVQGSRRMMTLMKSPAFAGTMVGLGLASYAIALKQMFDAGDDEDGESKYLKQIRDWDSQRAIPVRLGDEEYASIPVPYGPNVFSYLGWKAAEMHYKIATGKDPGIADATADVATNLSNSMSPIQVDAGYWNAVPEVARIFLQPIAANIDDFGNTISYAEKYAQPGDNTPAYQNADYRTGELFKLMSQFASFAFGGDEYEGGAVNIAPEKLRYITQQGLGGMYRLINESMELGQKMMDDSPIEPRDVPLSNVYLRSRDLNNQQSETFYQNRDEVTELRRIYKAAVEREDEDRIEAMLEENPWLDGSELSGNSRLGKKLQAGTPVGELRNAEREIRELRRERQDAYTGLGEYEGMARRDRMKRVREIDREIANAQRYFNASMNDRSPTQSLPAVQ